MMRYTTYFAAICSVLLISTGCTKEVEIDIPGHVEQLVIDGVIETGQPPIVLISKSKEVYAPTDLNAFLTGFVSGATVTVSDGTNTVELEEICSGTLTQAQQELFAQAIGITPSEIANYDLCAYLSLDPDIFGQVGKTYSLNVEFEGETYTAETRILNPTPLDAVWWKAEDDAPNHGYSWCTLSDPANQFDSYKWEVKRMASDADGNPEDDNFTETYNPIFNDEFFDGLTFDFFYENPFAYSSTLPENERWLFEYEDTVVIKLSKMDRNVYEFMEKKYLQLATAGNPFATPTNIPTNISGGALGIWAGYSPSFDTLICVP